MTARTRAGEDGRGCFGHDGQKFGIDPNGGGSIGCGGRMSAREFFESVREAVIDAERCRQQLEGLEHAALALPSGMAELHRGGTPSDRVGDGVAGYVDQEAALYRRVEDDYRLIDAACEVLYGHDGMSDGLASIAPSWWADSIYHHYLGLRTWGEIAPMMLYCESHVRRSVGAAFDLMDANGMTDTIEGRMHAEG